jgi:hypothetical protein
LNSSTLEKLVGEHETAARSGGGTLAVAVFVELMNDASAGSGNRA